MNLDKIIEKVVNTLSPDMVVPSNKPPYRSDYYSREKVEKAIRRTVEEALREVEIPEFVSADLDMLEEAGKHGYLDARDIQLANHKKLLSKPKK